MRALKKKTTRHCIQMITTQQSLVMLMATKQRVLEAQLLACCSLHLMNYNQVT